MCLLTTAASRDGSEGLNRGEFSLDLLSETSVQIGDGQRKAVACSPGEASAVTVRWQSGAATSAELPLGVKIVFVSAELESCVCGRHSSLTPAAVPISLFVSMPRAGSGDVGSVS